MQHCIVRRRPCMSVTDFCSFLAADAKGALFFLIEDVPHPGNNRPAFCHPHGEIATHAVGRWLFARDDCKASGLRFLVEILNQLLELARWQAIKGIESYRRAPRLGGGDGLPVGIATSQ